MNHIQSNPQSMQNGVSIFEIAPMLFAGLLISITIGWLWGDQRRKSEKREVEGKEGVSGRRGHRNRDEDVGMGNRLNRATSTKTFGFSEHEDYGDIEGHYHRQQQQRQQQHYRDSQSQEQELIDMLHDHPTSPPAHTYSLTHAKHNFLKHLQPQPSEPCIYLDENDLKERRHRKARLQERHTLVRTEIPKPKRQREQSQKGQINKAATKVQEKRTTVGERVVFGGGKEVEGTGEQQNNGMQKVGQKGVSFDNIGLGEMTVNKPMTQFTESKVQPPKQVGSLFGTQGTQPQGNSLFPNVGQNQNSQGLFSQNAGQQQSFFGPSVQPQQQPQGQPSTGVVPPKPVQQPKPSPVQSSQPAATTTQPTTGPVLPPITPSQPPTGAVLPPPTQPIQQPSQQPPRPHVTTLTKPDYLQRVIDYGSKAKEQCELKKTKINNFGRSISNFKQIYETAIDFINTINLGDPKQMQTLACTIFDFLLNKTIPVWPKQQGWQMFPPRTKNETKWKISISTYVLKLNIYRVMGYESLWLIVFGKLLSLLEFTWKRTQQIKKTRSAYRQLDLVKNGYFSLQKQDDMAPKYFTRLDLVTYFLFCMTTFDPELVGQYLCQTAGQDAATLEEIRKYKYKWSYNYFWILSQAILQNKTKTYFKPILHMNMLSAMYLQIRRNKQNSAEFEDFDHLRKYILKQAMEYTTPRALEENQEISALTEIEEETRDFKFDGEDFLGQLETLNFYFKEKEGEYRKATADRRGFEEFQKRCSVFSYFKSDSKM